MIRALGGKMESILESVKSYLGVMSDTTAFDVDILMSINAIMTVLNQFGIGPSSVFVVDSNSTWSDFLGEDPISGIREYVCMRVRMLFDPPSNNQIMAALKEQIAEFEWRILAEADRKASDE